MLRRAPAINHAARRVWLATSCALPVLLAASAGMAQSVGTLFITGSTYTGTASTVTIGETLPISTGATAIANGTYPTVFNNDAVDANFGITAPIEVAAVPVIYSAAGGTLSGPEIRIDATQYTGVATSFSSKSELGLHLSTDGTQLVFTGYRAGLNVLDVSNANTLQHADPTNTDIQTSTYRSIVQLNLASGLLSAVDTNAYSGNNMRGAVLAENANGAGQDEYLTVGNAGNGSGTPPAFIVNDTGVQSVVTGTAPATTTVGVQQGTPGSKTGFQYGFSVTEEGYAADKSGKDNNFRGATVFNNTLYVSKGSGSNGINTVYQVGTAGTLPTAANAASQTVTVLPGFPTNLAANIVDNSPTTEFYPFGIYFANATTMYVADEGPQDLTTDVNAGLQKWILVNGSWQLAYTIQAGLNLDVPYSVAGYPSQYNPATTGLRHVTGVVAGNSVVLFATTSTISTLADPGADPNQVVEVVDQLDATTLPANESFTTVAPPWARQVYRGVLFNEAAFTPSLVNVPR